MERIVTPRLTLRPVAPQDQAPVVAGLNDLAVSGWLSVVPHPYGPQDFEHFVTEIARPGRTWTIEEAGVFAGIVGLENAALGYWLMPSAHGRGIATEAAGAVLAAHFAAGGGDLVSGYFEGNQRSARVLGKLGFAETGRDVKFCRALGQDRAHVTLGLTERAFRLSAFNLA
ncbi:GNAT family N-acetyltransferase [Stagnihabitans tardus]|uniref:GNAT family N-acetyltransferase n=1 Tax=Stagnihabitans tardus TaxID=2699202 RepID=A0AAE4Y823_9RHOB|nr:GNAT family N-acetyltransferase [Stagnihabitans tardus]NBZ86912.1 GNAT family N-acetyltransferase [Stagnihabitans tardus]